MNIVLPPFALKEIRQCLSQTLADTFQMMFDLDVFLLPSNHPAQNDTTLYSYISLTGKEACAILCTSIDKPLAQFLAEALSPCSPNNEHIAQDIVCEINNIIGNRVRSYIHDRLEIDLAIGLPKMGEPPQIAQASNEIRLHFRIRETNSISLDFTYSPLLQSA